MPMVLPNIDLSYSGMAFNFFFNSSVCYAVFSCIINECKVTRYLYPDSYESKSLLLTTNLEFSKWGSIFTDDQMAAAMIDRLVHHGHLILFEGNSYRMEHALMKQTARQPESGTTSRNDVHGDWHPVLPGRSRNLRPAYPLFLK